MRRAVVVLLACTGLLAAGCSSDEPTQSAGSTDVSEAAPAPKPVRRCVAGTKALRSDGLAYGAVVLHRTTAMSRPGGHPIARFEPINVNGVSTVLGVLGVRRTAACQASWYRVQLPVRPNGTVGWVRAADVRLRRVSTRIVVDLSDRRVTLFKDGVEVLGTTAAIGKPGTPTPTGRFYVNQRLVAPDPSGPFGPGAVGISAFSPTLQHWAQGGPIAIHGTNAPARLGDAVSFGCVRIVNSALLRLFEEATEGTPVVVRS